MKKFFSILMIICLMFYSSGYILLYFYSINAVKSFQINNLAENIRTGETAVTRFIIPLNSTDIKIEITDDGDELLYCGKIFDILNSCCFGDTLFVTAVYDDKENLLNEAFAGISVAKKDFQSEVMNFTLLQSGLLLFNNAETDNLSFNPVFICFCKDKPEIITDVFLTNITPPPRYHYC